MSSRSRLARSRSLIVAVAGGVAFALSSPPTDLYPLVLVGLGALYWALADARTAWRAAGRGLAWATAAGIVGMRFVPAVVDNFTNLGKSGGVLALLLLSSLQGLAWAIGSAVHHVMSRRLGLEPRLTFAAGVVIAISVPTVFAWTPAGLLSAWPALLQLAEYIGGRGVSFLLAAASAFVAHAALASNGRSWRRRALSPAIGVGLLGVMALHGAIRMAQVRRTVEGRPTIRIGVVQAAVPARLRWEKRARYKILGWLRRLTIQAERRGAELTVWPEAAYPFRLDHEAPKAPPGRRAIVGAGVKGPVLAGLITKRADGDGSYNAATLIGADRSMQPPQAKMQLLWFGETIPLSGYLPFLRRIFFRTGGLVPGEAVRLQEHGAARIGVLNCYEDTLAPIGRRVARAGPNLLINVTNDAWFGPTAEPELHLRLSVVRSIESRLDLVRAVNLGVPAWIDATGTVRARGPDSAQGVMMVNPAVATNDASPTLYTKVGDTPLWLGLALACLGALVWTRRESPVSEATEPDPSKP